MASMIRNGKKLGYMKTWHSNRADGEVMDRGHSRRQEDREWQNEWKEEIDTFFKDPIGYPHANDSKADNDSTDNEDEDEDEDEDETK